MAGCCTSILHALAPLFCSLCLRRSSPFYARDSADGCAPIPLLICWLFVYVIVCLLSVCVQDSYSLLSLIAQAANSPLALQSGSPQLIGYPESRSPSPYHRSSSMTAAPFQ